MNYQNHDSSKDIQDSFQNSSRYFSPFRNRNTKKHLVKVSEKVGKNILSKLSSFSSKILSNPKVVLILCLIVVIVICIMIPVSLISTKDSENKSIYESKEAYKNMMPSAIQSTASAIEEIYEQTKLDMENKALDFIDSNYSDSKEYIHITYTMDDLNTTATNITGYIQAVNSVLFNYLPIDENEKHSSGMDTENGLNVEEENEFNSLGEEYQKCIQEYAKESPLFTILLTPAIQKTTVKEVITDEDGKPILDEFGNQQYESKEVYAGDLYVDVTYDISDYKKDDIDKASSIYYSQVKDTVKNETICKTQIQDAISEMLYILTGSKAIPVSHTYFNQQWDMLTSSTETSSYIFDGETSEGWTLPVANAIRSAGTWNYQGGGKHLGYDFASEEGTEIVAVANGIVLVSADGCAYGGLGSSCAGVGGSTSGGNQVYLLVTVKEKLYAVKYLHMKLGTPIAQGTQVKAGDTIGQVGSTGNSSGSHCHVEIFYLGDASNFQEYLDSWNGDLSFGCGWAGSYDGYGRRCEAGYDTPCRIRPETVFGE